ncbi:MAG: hypothetical protein JSV75_00560, partial [Candidatus Bathyarchaeota archaeon]
KMKCRICSKTCTHPSEGYCRLHQKAHRTVTQKYEDWKTALNTSWKEYLHEILKNPHTGSWAKEVVEKLISEKK